MDFVELFIKGIVIGVVIATPVGPIGFLCISRTLEYGAAIGLATGLGAAMADTVYGAVAAYGLMQVAITLSQHDGVLRIVGGAALCLIGLRTLFLADRKQQEAAAKGTGDKPGLSVASLQAVRGLPGSFGSSFLLTLANPVTMFGFVAIFAAVGWARELGTHANASVLVVGVFIGSAIWWLGLATVTALLSNRMGDHQKVWFQRLSGMVLVGFGVFALLSALT